MSFEKISQLPAASTVQATDLIPIVQNVSTTPVTNAATGAQIQAASTNGLTITATTATLTIASGKTATINNTLTLTGTDGSTLNVGAGGTLGSNAYTSTAYAPLASPALTGAPTAPTAAASTNTTQIATTAFVLANSAAAASTADLLAQSAAVASILAVTAPNDAVSHQYSIGGYIAVTAISAGTLTFQVTFTDENSTSQTVSFFGMGLTTAAISTTGFTAFAVARIRVKFNTVITVKTTFTGASVTYDVGASINRVN